MKKLTTLKSGHKLTVNLASFALASELKSTIAQELQTRVTLSGMSESVVFALLAGNKKAAVAALAGADVNVLWNVVLTLMGSRAIEAAVFECAKTCMLNAQGPDEKITRETFEPENARRDLIPVALEVMKENLIPFFEDLFSPSSDPKTGVEPSPQ